METLRHGALAFLCSIVIFGCILFAHAESQLEASIRAALQADPRASYMSAVEFDALVVALANEAERRGMRPDTIATTTPEFRESVTDTACTGAPETVCAWALIFGADPATFWWTLLLVAALAALGILGWLWHRLPLHTK